MDDRIIDFNEIKNKANEKDVDKLENYMYSLYYDMAEGRITMADFTKKMYAYMEDNNISQDKFFNIQKKLMERYGFDPSNLEEQLKNAGISISNITPNYEEVRKTLSFQEKYENKVETKAVSIYKIKNEKNDLEIIESGNENEDFSTQEDDNDEVFDEKNFDFSQFGELPGLNETLCEDDEEFWSEFDDDNIKSSTCPK